MTEAIEGVAFGVVDAAKVKCPFHEKEHNCTPDAKNRYLEGDAEALGVNLHEGKEANSTVQRPKGSPDHRYRRQKQELDPDKRPEEKREVRLIRNDEDTEYPVAFAAHHLIPGKASMGNAKALHRFVEEGEICCNLGYSVDGNENGVWLPGLHAVNAKGLNVWRGPEASKALPDKEDIRNVAKVKPKMRKELQASGKDGIRQQFTYKPLVGKNPGSGGAQAFRVDNMKWLYVQASMKYLSPRQFHDSHPAYSGKVLKQLGSVAQCYAKLLENAKKGAKVPCEECQKRRQKAMDKPTPPIALLGTLNKMSAWYRAELTGRNHLQNSQYYTSTWCGPVAKVKPRAKKGK